MTATAEQLELAWVPELSPRVRAGLTSMVKPSWQNDAACVDDRPRLFDDPDEDPNVDPADTAVARSICHDCPVRSACLASALLNDEWGVWGGHTNATRDDIRRALADPNRRLAVLGPGFYRDGSPITTGEAA